ncbi:hypothetical protein OG338_16915 [Streptomyces sp. NBC_00726]|uniref:hypothetical protein n=1 Tax=Streptomyces sp. NBC_00726 TaxID=2903674 RepID=UPI0038709757
MRRTGMAIAALFSAVSAVGFSGGPAAAGVTTEYVSDNCEFMNCAYGDLILNYHSVATSGQGNPSGSFAQFYGNIYDLAGTYVNYNGASAVHYIYIFLKGQGDGGGQKVKNNAASANNCSTVDGYRVYYNSGYAGHSQSIPHYWSCASSTNLDSTLKNENASLHFA